VLHARSAVLLEVGQDLRLALAADGRLVDGQQHRLAVGRQHHRIEARVDRADVLRGELGELVEAGHAHDVVDRFKQVGHVADDMIDALDAVSGLVFAHACLVARQEGQRVERVARDEAQHRVAIGV